MANTEEGEFTSAFSTMGHSQTPPTLTSMEQALKRHLERCDIGGVVKRRRSWREETPPPSPPHHHQQLQDEQLSDDEDDWSGDDMDTSESLVSPAASPVAGCGATTGYRGSILASCLLADRVSGEHARQNCWYSSSAEMAPSRLLNQTVECDGKSYIELGAMACPRRQRSQLYRHQRFAVLHATMLKLGRHRRLTDPHLRKSVLLYNTMRGIERELEQEGLSLAAAFNPHQFDAGCLTLDPPPPQTPAPLQPVPAQQQLAPPPAVDEPINWGSVLSIASQPDLLSNLLEPLPPLSAEDVLSSVPDVGVPCSSATLLAL